MEGQTSTVITEGQSSSSPSTINQRKEKKTKGRRKVEMKRIQKKDCLNVTFSKRRKGLFKKAGSLCALCNTEMAILVLSPVGKPYAWGYPSHESVIQRFLQGNASDRSNVDECVQEVQEGKREEFQQNQSADDVEDSSMGWQSNAADVVDDKMQMVDLEETVLREACTQDFLIRFS